MESKFFFRGSYVCVFFFKSHFPNPLVEMASLVGSVFES